MKKILLGVFCFVALLCFSNQEAKAQWSLGGGIGYGFDAEYPYLDVRAWYDVSKTVRIVPEFTYYLEGDDFWAFWSIDGNVHYLIVQSASGLFYALGGVQVAGVTIDTGFTSISETEIGLNLGLGGELPISPAVNLFGEVKATIAGFDQVAAVVGLRFPL